MIGMKGLRPGEAREQFQLVPDEPAAAPVSSESGTGSTASVFGQSPPSMFGSDSQSAGGFGQSAAGRFGQSAAGGLGQPSPSMFGQSSTGVPLLGGIFGSSHPPGMFDGDQSSTTLAPASVAVTQGLNFHTGLTPSSSFDGLPGALSGAPSEGALPEALEEALAAPADDQITPCTAAAICQVSPSSLQRLISHATWSEPVPGAWAWFDSGAFVLNRTPVVACPDASYTEGDQLGMLMRSVWSGVCIPDGSVHSSQCARIGFDDAAMFKCQIQYFDLTSQTAAQSVQQSVVSNLLTPIPKEADEGINYFLVNLQQLQQELPLSSVCPAESTGIGILVTGPFSADHNPQQFHIGAVDSKPAPLQRQTSAASTALPDDVCQVYLQWGQTLTVRANDTCRVTPTPDSEWSAPQALQISFFKNGRLVHQDALSSCDASLRLMHSTGGVAFVGLTDAASVDNQRTSGGFTLVRQLPDDLLSAEIDLVLQKSALHPARVHRAAALFSIWQDLTGIVQLGDLCHAADCADASQILSTCSFLETAHAALDEGRSQFYLEGFCNLLHLSLEEIDDQSFYEVLDALEAAWPVANSEGLWGFRATVTPRSLTAEGKHRLAESSPGMCSG